MLRAGQCHSHVCLVGLERGLERTLSLGETYVLAKAEKGCGGWVPGPTPGPPEVLWNHQHEALLCDGKGADSAQESGREGTLGMLWARTRAQRSAEAGPRSPSL